MAEEVTAGSRGDARGPSPAARLGAHVSRLAASSTARRLAGRAAWSVLGSGAARLLALVGAILVARALGASAFGEFNLVQTTTGMLMALGGFGLNTTATKFLAGRYRADADAAGRVVALSGALAAVTGGATAILLFATAPWVAREVLGTPQLAFALRVGSILIALGPVTGAQLGVLMGLERFRLIAAVTTLAAAIGVPLVAIGARAGGVLGAVVALVGSVALTAAIYGWAVRSATRAAGIAPRWRDAHVEWRAVLSYSVPMTLSNLLVAPVAWATSAIVARQPEGLRELGVFAAGNQWRNAIVLLATSAGAVLFPLFSRLHDSGRARSLSRAFWASLGATTIAALAAAGALAALARPLMRTYGAEFSGGARVLLLLVAAGALSAPLTVVSHAIAGAGRMWQGFALTFAWGVALLALAWTLRDRGATGLALAHVGAYGVHLALGVAYAAAILRHGAAAPAAVPAASPGGLDAPG